MKSLLRYPVKMALIAIVLLAHLNCNGHSIKKEPSVQQQSATAPPPAHIVDTSKQLYSYAEMMEDLNELQRYYPECVKVETRGKSYQGRAIPVVTFGNPTAQQKVMIQSAIHAREYLSAQLVMAMLEHYAKNYSTGSYQGRSLRDLFQQVGLVILPMVNPDGVEIAQKGEKGAKTEDVRLWIRQHTQAGVSHTQIKSNARGVDLNRNFQNGFGKDRKVKWNKDYSHYPGEYPHSEIESQLLLTIAQEHNYVCFLNYHTCGNLVYYGCKNASERVNTKALKMSQLIKRHTGFPLYGPTTSPECGSWADEVEVLYGRPSATIELGTRNPVPIAEFSDLYKKNLWIWADLARTIVNGDL